MEWLVKTRALLEKAPRNLTLSKIAEDTGLKVSWLSAFASGSIADPGIIKVQKLYTYLLPIIPE